MMKADAYGLNNGDYAFFFYYDFPSQETYKPYNAGPPDTAAAKMRAVKNLKIVRMTIRIN